MTTRNRNGEASQWQLVGSLRTAAESIDSLRHSISMLASGRYSEATTEGEIITTNDVLEYLRVGSRHSRELAAAIARRLTEEHRKETK